MVVCYREPPMNTARALALPLLASVAALSLLGAGCKKDAPPPTETTAEGETSRSTTQPATIAAAPRGVGVPECDQYLRKYEACLRGSSAPASGALLALKAQRDSYRIAAATPEGKSTLKAQCQAQMDRLATDKACAGPR